MNIRAWLKNPRVVFFLIYTLCFALAMQAVGFVLPFVIAMIVAVVMKPLYDYLRERFRFRSTFAATLLTLLIFGVLFAAVGFLLFLVIRQALSLFTEYRYMITDYLTSGELLDNLRALALSGNLFKVASGVAGTLFQAVPMTITFVVVTFALTVFFLHHLGDIRRRLTDRAGEDYAPLLGRVMHIAYTMVRRFIRSYLLLYLITFAEAVVIFYLTGVEYPLAFAFIAAVADILPVLGPGAVYLPLAAVMILQKNYISGVALVIGFLVTVAVRQILEPRIVSDSVKVHPLVVLSAIYFSILSMNIGVLFYILSLFMVYRVLNLAGAFEKAVRQPTKG